MLFNIRREMISFIDQYYDINQKLLTIMGLWPYQKWKSRIFQITLFPIVLISFLIAQVCIYMLAFTLILRSNSYYVIALLHILNNSIFNN